MSGSPSMPSPPPLGPPSAPPPIADRNLADLVSAAAARDPDHPALIEVSSGRQMSWCQVDRAVSAEAARLAEHGVAAADRVVLRLPTGAALSVALFGAVRAGAVAVPVSPGGTERELGAVLDSAAPVLLITESGDPVAGAAAAAAGVSVAGPPDLDTPAPDRPAGGGDAPTGRGEDIAVLVYTSGTSGRPKGVMLSHRALLANLEQCAVLRPAPMTAADRVLIALPLHHSYGLGPGLLQVANCAATAVLAAWFDPETALDAIYRYRATVVVGVPSMYRALLALPAERAAAGLHTVRMLVSGAAPLDPEVSRRLRALIGLDVFEGYGLTETGPVLTSTLVTGRAKPGSVGRPLPGAPSRGVAPVELRLVDAAGHALPAADADDEDAGGAGVVAVRGPSLFSGYWPDRAGGPEELPGLGPGWLRTGDVGYLDREGELHLVDRSDDLIIVSGFNVYPREVEQVLAEHPAVREAAAVGIPHPSSGEAVCAVVVAEPGAGDVAADLVAHCAQRLARFKVPVRVDLVSALPRAPTGEVDRRALREALGPG